MTWTWRGHERSWALPGLVLITDKDNCTYFPPDIFYFVLQQDPRSATVSLELREVPMPSLSQGFQETPAGLIRG